jgi:hypothetical protein
MTATTTKYGLATAANVVEVWDLSMPATQAPNSKSDNPSPSAASVASYARAAAPQAPAASVNVVDVAWSGDYRHLAAATPTSVYVYQSGVIEDVIVAPGVADGIDTATITAVSMGWRSSRNVFLAAGRNIHIWDRKDHRFATVLQVGGVLWPC